ncbi:hypothetical protein TTHERM_001220449 (macronuclear) [Tetrahymena thermophila SB210]|uniref:Uncharacterized protein n=1 Tax=Tetrahymena thermophila (strain SB210) TaxID=312017 RepID=W7WXI8_TETTS|nr:hypothetical protein TTHERM_001220449 [Tetrahymena thermophila SB210]EWS71520.1 hypothetical protein TTHERM_001220449 [Tetrahymena thermophila SB210]|eukprot:XP_012655948.1 hypothetical protein TTHERM_001220449 [Tetrahymena thermophila SB210]
MFNYTFIYTGQFIIIDFVVFEVIKIRSKYLSSQSIQIQNKLHYVVLKLKSIKEYKNLIKITAQCIFFEYLYTFSRFLNFQNVIQINQIKSETINQLFFINLLGFYYFGSEYKYNAIIKRDKQQEGVMGEGKRSYLIRRMNSNAQQTKMYSEERKIQSKLLLNRQINKQLIQLMKKLGIYRIKWVSQLDRQIDIWIDRQFVILVMERCLKKKNQLERKQLLEFNKEKQVDFFDKQINLKRRGKGKKEKKEKRKKEKIFESRQKIQQKRFRQQKKYIISSNSSLCANYKQTNNQTIKQTNKLLSNQIGIQPNQNQNTKQRQITTNLAATSFNQLPTYLSEIFIQNFYFSS